MFNDDRSTQLGCLNVVPNMCLKFATDWGTYCQVGFSSVSARKLKCPSSARLGLGPFQLGSAWEISARTHHYYAGKLTVILPTLMKNSEDI